MPFIFHMLMLPAYLFIAVCAFACCAIFTIGILGHWIKDVLCNLTADSWNWFGLKADKYCEWLEGKVGYWYNEHAGRIERKPNYKGPQWRSKPKTLPPPPPPEPPKAVNPPPPEAPNPAVVVKICDERTTS